MSKKYVFDFDSTLTSVEALDVLAEITLENNPNRDKIVEEIKAITNLGIDGEISFTESLKRRLALLKADKNDLKELVSRLEKKISTSIKNNKEFFLTHSDDIYVISCGFKEFIDPIVADYNIPSEKVFANTFEFDSDGYISGFDSKNVLSQHNGKIDCLKGMNLDGEIQVIGDGYSDYVMREAGIADKFFAYTENVQRDKAISNADHVTPSLDEFLYLNDLPRKISYPKHRIKILLLENVHPDAFNTLTSEGFSVETVKTSLSEEDLIKKIKGVHVIGIRSKTQITQKVLDAADKLMVIGAFCIGTTQINLPAAKAKGVVVFNAPYSNTRSVVELAIGEIIMLARSIFPRSTEIHNGQWNKTAAGSQEVRGKNLGIIGYGNIGKQLSVIAEGMGMNVYFYDLDEQLSLGNATKCTTIEDVLAVSDFVSLHVDDNKANTNLFNAERFAQMKPGSVFVNLARGFVVDIPALVDALKSGHLKGAAVDVFPEEPVGNGDFITELQGLDNVILTPHIGGSTEEAQRDIADFVPNKIMNYINSGNTVDAVNFPNIRLPKQESKHRFLHIHHNVSGVMAKINEILAKYELNISAQFLSTDPEVGYVITEVDKEYNKEVIDELKAVSNTIKFRVLY